MYTVSRRTQPPRRIKQLTWSDTKTAGSIVRSYFQHLKKCHFWERLLWLLVLAVALEQLQQFSLPSEFCESGHSLPLPIDLSHQTYQTNRATTKNCLNLLISGYEQTNSNCSQSVKVLMSTLLPRCHLSKYHTQQTVQKTSAQFNRVLLLLSELSIIQSPVLLLDLGQV